MNNEIYNEKYLKISEKPPKKTLLGFWIWVFLSSTTI